MSEQKDKSTRNPFAEILYFVRGTISEEVNCQLLGKVLTIVDGAIVDEKQNKAIKDLIKGEFYRKVTGMNVVISDCVEKAATLLGRKIKGEQHEEASPLD